MKKILLVFGTRPEAIKMMPLVMELKKNTYFKTFICVTGQHKELLSEVLDLFEINPEFNLCVMKSSQTLFSISSKILIGIEDVYNKIVPDIVLVHGDTTTAFIATLAAFYKKIDIGHVEAGLRTHDIYSPYPEEFNRQAVSIIAKYHFAPTSLNKQNLVNEGVNPKNIYITGNTAIDVFKYTVKDPFKDPILDWLDGYKLIILTAHRRETSDESFRAIFNTINDIIQDNNLKLLCPVHPSPRIKKLALEAFQHNDKVFLSEPLDIVRFHNLLAKAHIIITDSGGIQEEAPSLNVPVLVIRNKTERLEALKVGTIKLIGTDPIEIKRHIEKILSSKRRYKSMTKKKNPYGQGNAAKKIIEILNTNL